MVLREPSPARPGQARPAQPSHLLHQPFSDVEIFVFLSFPMVLLSLYWFYLILLWFAWVFQWFHAKTKVLLGFSMDLREPSQTRPSQCIGVITKLGVMTRLRVMHCTGVLSSMCKFILQSCFGVKSCLGVITKLGVMPCLCVMHCPGVLSSMCKCI